MNDTIAIKKLPSGHTCYVFPKKDYVGKQAAFSVDYGSADTRYIINGQSKESPLGGAHFLEHKMFESQDANVFGQFTGQGASVNAYTNFNNTSYYFTTIDNFNENLSLLLSFVQDPYFTDENVEKEKGIIQQEIDMYRDDPQWKLYINLQQALFHQSPVRNDILGTSESVWGIGKDILYKCYRDFYVPSHMSLVCAGDLDAESIFETAERLVSGGERPSIERLYGNEPSESGARYTEESMPVSMPLFQIGYKHLYENPTDAVQMGKTFAAMQILTDMLAGESSPMYETLYGNGLIDNQFSVSYIGGTFFGTALFTGPSREPKQSEESLLAEIARFQKQGLPQDRFEIIKQKTAGRYIRALNALDYTVTVQTDLHGKGLDVYTQLDNINNVTLHDAEDCLRCFQEECHALSVIMPKK